jgi:ion channel
LSRSTFGIGGVLVEHFEKSCVERRRTVTMPPTTHLDQVAGNEARMSRPAAKTVQRRFLMAFGRAVYITWPVLSSILAVQAALGLLIGFVEGWSFGDAVYFTFVTGLTIGYGDIVPREALTRALAVGIGFCGILLTGLVAAIAVYAMREALPGR